MYVKKRILVGDSDNCMHFIIIHQTGWTPLISASFHGHAAVVELLLQNGADVSICIEVLYSLATNPKACTCIIYTSAMLSIFGRTGATLLVVVNELPALYICTHKLL